MAKEDSSLQKAALQALNAVNRLGAKAASAQQKERQRDHRRKIVCGAAILTMVQKDPALAARFESFLEKFASRKSDREALDLDTTETFIARAARVAEESAAALGADALKPSEVDSALGALGTHAAPQAAREPRNEGVTPRASHAATGASTTSTNGSPTRSAGTSTSSLPSA